MQYQVQIQVLYRFDTDTLGFYKYLGIIDDNNSLWVIYQKVKNRIQQATTKRLMHEQLASFNLNVYILIGNKDYIKRDYKRQVKPIQKIGEQWHKRIIPPEESVPSLAIASTTSLADNKTKLKSTITKEANHLISLVYEISKAPQRKEKPKQWD